MKHKSLWGPAALVFLLALGAGCGKGGAEPDSLPASSGAQSVSRLCRVVEGEGESLLLADLEGSEEIYRLSLKDLPVEDESGRPAQVQEGMEVRVEYSGEVDLTYPATFRQPTALILTGRQENLCSLYLQVLGDLWEQDTALNEGALQVGVDLSSTRLSESE